MNRCHLRNTLAVAVLALVLPGATYVSPTGDDLAPGTLESPLRTVKSALLTLAAGDTLILLGGTYGHWNQGAANMVGFRVPADDIVVRKQPGMKPILNWTGIPAPHAAFFDDGVGADNLLIEGLTLRNWAGPSPFFLTDDSNGLTLRNCDFEGIGPYAGAPIVAVVGVQDVTIESCRFVGRPVTSPYYAISLFGGPDEAPERYAVRTCTFNDSTALSSLLGHGAGILATRVDELEIVDCEGYNAGNNHAPGPRHFIELRDVDDGLVRSVRLRRYLFGNDQTHPLHDADGVKTGSFEGDPSSGVRIEDSELWGAGHGVHVGDGSEDVDLFYVWCDSTYDDGVFVSDLTQDVRVRQVVTHMSQDNGIDVQGDGVWIEACTIVRPNSAAIRVAGTAEGLSVRDLLVHDVRDALLWPGALTYVEPPTSWQFDYNAWYDPDGPTAYYFDGTSRTFADWQSAGHDANGVFGVDPHLCNPDGRAWPAGSTDFALAPDSPLATAASDGGPVGAIAAMCGVVSVEDPGVAPPPARLLAVPNPARRGIPLTFSTRAPVEVFDASGRRVRSLPGGTAGATVVWDGRDVRGRWVAPGVYFVRGDRLGGRVVITR